jgi:hypothetical protein
MLWTAGSLLSKVSLNGLPATTARQTRSNAMFLAVSCTVIARAGHRCLVSASRYSAWPAASRSVLHTASPQQRHGHHRPARAMASRTGPPCAVGAADAHAARCRLGRGRPRARRPRSRRAASGRWAHALLETSSSPPATRRCRSRHRSRRRTTPADSERDARGASNLYRWGAKPYNLDRARAGSDQQPVKRDPYGQGNRIRGRKAPGEGSGTPHAARRTHQWLWSRSH